MARTNEELKAAVERGISWIELKMGPDWIHEIDLSKLSILFPNSCILGQLGYELVNGFTGNAIDETTNHGFMASDGGPLHYTHESKILTDLWVEAIQTKLEQGPVVQGQNTTQS